MSSRKNSIHPHSDSDTEEGGAPITVEDDSDGGAPCGTAAGEGPVTSKNLSPMPVADSNAVSLRDNGYHQACKIRRFLTSTFPSDSDQEQVLKVDDALLSKPAVRRDLRSHLDEWYSSDIGKKERPFIPLPAGVESTPSSYEQIGAIENTLHVLSYVLNGRAAARSAAMYKTLVNLRQSAGMTGPEEAGAVSQMGSDSTVGQSGTGLKAGATIEVRLLEQRQRSQITQSLERLYQAFRFNASEAEA